MLRASSLPIIVDFSTVHSAVVSLMQAFDDRFQAESGWNCFHPDSAWKLSSKACIKLITAECTVENSTMMGKEDARNM